MFTRVKEYALTVSHLGLFPIIGYYLPTAFERTLQHYRVLHALTEVPLLTPGIFRP